LTAVDVRDFPCPQAHQALLENPAQRPPSSQLKLLTRLPGKPLFMSQCITLVPCNRNKPCPKVPDPNRTVRGSSTNPRTVTESKPGNVSGDKIIAGDEACARISAHPDALVRIFHERVNGLIHFAGQMEGP
jgi:hypothetical protein